MIDDPREQFYMMKLAEKDAEIARLHALEDDVQKAVENAADSATTYGDARAPALRSLVGPHDWRTADIVELFGLLQNEETSWGSDECEIRDCEHEHVATARTPEAARCIVLAVELAASMYYGLADLRRRMPPLPPFDPSTAEPLARGIHVDFLNVFESMHGPRWKPGDRVRMSPAGLRAYLKNVSLEGGAPVDARNHAAQYGNDTGTVVEPRYPGQRVVDVRWDGDATEHTYHPEHVEHAERARSKRPDPVPDIPSPCSTLPDPATYGYDPPVPRLVAREDVCPMGQVWKRGEPIGPGFFLTGEYLMGNLVVGAHSLAQHMHLVYVDAGACRFTTSKPTENAEPLGALRGFCDDAPRTWRVYTVTRDAASVGR